MQVIVLTNDVLKEELLNNGVDTETELAFISAPQEFLNYPKAFACIDLLFENDEERLHMLKQITTPVIINSVQHTLHETNFSFIRINAWPTFLQSNLIEASASDEKKQKAEIVFAQFNKKIEWLPDEPGFITPRVISAIINEAFIALEEGVSTKEEIDKAMKLGTNYPYGPFEWANKIGIKNIASLLTKLSLSQRRYSPSSLLMRQAQ